MAAAPGNLAGFRLTAATRVHSTNDAALEAAMAGDVGRHWFTARTQSGGRGRGGRPWQSIEGNLFATLLLLDPCAGPDLPKLGFVAGVALIEALEAATGTHGRFALKWPNDVLIDGAKLAGILLEARRTPAGRSAVAIGIGVNCAAAPRDLPYAATSLAVEGLPVAAPRLLDLLIARMAAALDIFAGGAGFANVRARWLASAHGVGTPVEARLAERTLRGAFAGIDTDGRLLLRAETGCAAIDAADVFFPGSIA